MWTRIATSRFHQVALVLLGTVLLAISAQIQVPFWPVPMTMQTFVVLMIGATYGWRLGGATMIAYIAEGAIGLPVFAQFSAGAHVLVGPTAGYLVGFVVAALVTGYLSERGFGRNLATAAISFAAGTIIIFACGLALSVQPDRRGQGDRVRPDAVHPLRADQGGARHPAAARLLEAGAPLILSPSPTRKPAQSTPPLPGR